MQRVAYTTGAWRKFQFAPTLVQSKGAIYVAIGTGDREHPLVDQYPYTNPIVNRFYLFADKFDGVEINLDGSSMIDVTTGQPKTGCDAEVITPASSKRGWFFDLTDNGRGEQVVTSAAVVGGLVAFSTNRPTPEPLNACAANLGEARGYLVNLLTGSGVIGPGNTDCGLQRSSVFEGGGLPPSPVIARVVIDGQVRTVAIGVAQKDATLSSSIEAQRIRPSVNSIRKPTYWLNPRSSE
jgi:type IV pilus assembly protein PilY1